MLKKIFVYLQYLYPQHLLSALVGRLADSPHLWLKNFLIQQFIRHYQIDLTDARLKNPDDYPTFNDFFIRQLDSDRRPIAADDHAIVSPVDGSVSQIGNIRKNQLVQAKQSYFDLEHLLGGDTHLAEKFYDGAFATLYLAPANYHRVHMPLTGKLIQSIYIPGRLFSVNTMTSTLIPNLYSRNERLVCVFDTDAGQIVIVMVGALIVGSIQTVWMQTPIRANHILTHNHAITLEKGAELGFFKMGSTVILLAEKDRIHWSKAIAAQAQVQFGEKIGSHSAQNV